MVNRPSSTAVWPAHGLLPVAAFAFAAMVASVGCQRARAPGRAAVGPGAAPPISEVRADLLGKSRRYVEQRFGLPREETDFKRECFAENATPEQVEAWRSAQIATVYQEMVYPRFVVDINIAGTVVAVYAPPDK